MGVFNGVFPIQAGKEEDARAFAAETFGARRPDFEAHLARVGVTRETWALQETPMGSLMLVWFEGGVEKAFVDLATATRRQPSTKTRHNRRSVAVVPVTRAHRTRVVQPAFWGSAQIE